MSINKYSDVVTEIKNWSFRNDLTDEQIGQFVYLTGNLANQFLRVPPMENTVLLQVHDGNRVEIPNDYLELRSLTAPWNSYFGKPLEYVSWDQFVNHNNETLGTGEETLYYSRQGPYWFVSADLGEDATLTCHYYRSMPDISPTEQTNWLVDMSPAAYLFGGLHFLYLFVMDTERSEYWLTKFQGEVIRIQALSDKAEHSGTRLAIRNKSIGG